MRLIPCAVTISRGPEKRCGRNSNGVTTAIHRVSWPGHRIVRKGRSGRTCKDDRSIWEVAVVTREKQVMEIRINTQTGTVIGVEEEKSKSNGFIGGIDDMGHQLKPREHTGSSPSSRIYWTRSAISLALAARWLRSCSRSGCSASSGSLQPAR